MIIRCGCRRLKSVSITLLLLLAGCSAEPGTHAIRAVSLFPSQSDYSKDFRNWIDHVNKLGQEQFRIIYVGGPEAVSTYEQADAIRTGVVHMVFGPATYYLGILPEVEALFASNLLPWETRENGGIELMDRIHRQRMGVRYLARAAFIEFHLFTRERPEFDADGLPDLGRLKIRGGPVWREFITALGATFINVAAPDIYTALERGMVDGLGWPIVGLADSSWDKHLNFRIDPGVFSSDVSIIFNSEKWEQLSPAARTVIQDAAIEYEYASYHHFKEITEIQDQDMRESGMEIIDLPEAGAALYRKLAADVIWQRLKNRSPENYNLLREKFYRE